MSDEDDGIVSDLLKCAADSREVEGDYYADQFSTGAEIFERAADEIKRLRLTDAERKAIDAAAHAAAQLYVGPDGVALAATLRGLLERTK